MKMSRLAALSAAPFCLALAMPAHAQNYPFTEGDYVEIGMISVDDGHGIDYANFLADRWRKQQEFAKSQGWITSYEVDANVHKRPGEADLYLITRYRSLPDPAEQARRDQAMRDHFKQDDAAMEAQSGERAKYRKQMGSMLLQQQIFK